MAQSFPEFTQNTQTFFFVFLSGYPKFVFVFHNLGEYGAAREYHIFASRRVLDPDFEFL